ncbi:MAG: YciI family protein [Cucumibacter sp.]
MHSVVICRDQPNSRDLRAATRPEHLAHAKQHTPRMLVAGALLGADGKPVGSLFIFKSTSLEEARKIMDADPYVRAGLFESVTIERWRWVVNRPDGVEEE